MRFSPLLLFLVHGIGKGTNSYLSLLEQSLLLAEETFPKDFGQASFFR